MSEIFTRDNGIWAIVVLLLFVVSAAIGFIVGGVLTPIIGILGGIVAFVLGGMKAANVVFDFLDNVESRVLGGDEDVQEPPTIGGQNVTRREEFINEQLDRLDGWFTVYEGDTWEIHPVETIADDPTYLLYLLAAKVAHENGAREQPEVSIAELEREVEARFPTGPFINKSRYFLTLHYDPDEEWVGHSIEEEEATVEFDFDAIEEGVDWILSGNRNPPREYDSG